MDDYAKLLDTRHNNPHLANKTEITVDITLLQRSLFIQYIVTTVWKAENTAVENRHADHLAPSIRKIWH
jgi:hypothetical protein